jgi:hypothetical protein
LRAMTHGAPAYRGGGEATGVARSSGGEAVRRPGNGMDRLGGGAGRRLLFSGPVARAETKRGAGGGVGSRGSAPHGGENGEERGSEAAAVSGADRRGRQHIATDAILNRFKPVQTDSNLPKL